MGRGEIPMRAVPPPVRVIIFYIKGVPRRFFLSNDEPTYNGVVLSTVMMNGDFNFGTTWPEV